MYLPGLFVISSTCLVLWLSWVEALYNASCAFGTVDISYRREILLNLEGFQYSTSMDLNMGYYNICLRYQASNLCTIILPRGKYKYKRLPMGICNSPEIFQDKINVIFCGFEFIRAFIDDILIITKGDWYYHLNKLEQVLQKLKENRIKCNTNN